MSGPKIDAVSIERMRAMQLAAEQSRNDSMLRNALLQLSEKIHAYKANCLELREYRDCMLQELDDFEQKIRFSLISTATHGYPSDPESAKIFNDMAEKKLLELISEIDNLVDPIVKNIESAMEVVRLESFDEKLSEGSLSEYGYLSSEQIQALIGQAVHANKDYSADPFDMTVSILGEAEEVMRRLRVAIISEATDQSRKRQLTEIARRINESLRSYDAGDATISLVQHVLSVAKPVISEMEIHTKVMNELYLDALIAKSRIEQSSGFSVNLMPIWEYNEERDLETTLHDLRDISRKCLEDAYVVYALDEVMAKHGYSIAKPITLSDIDQDGHRLFMNESSDIAIHTYLASNGVLAMEIAAVDELVRSQNNNELVQKQPVNTTYDIIRLVQEQETFCELHPEIIADLAAYGIIINQIKDRKPSEDCAVVFKSSLHSSASEATREKKHSSRRNQTSSFEREMR